MGSVAHFITLFSIVLVNYQLLYLGRVWVSIVAHIDLVRTELTAHRIFRDQRSVLKLHLYRVPKILLGGVHRELLADNFPGRALACLMALTNAYITYDKRISNE